MWHVRTWFSGPGGDGSMVGLGDLSALSFPAFIILWFTWRRGGTTDHQCCTFLLIKNTCTSPCHEEKCQISELPKAILKELLSYCCMGKMFSWQKTTLLCVQQVQLGPGTSPPSSNTWLHNFKCSLYPMLQNHRNSGYKFFKCFFLQHSLWFLFSPLVFGRDQPPYNH